MPKGRNSNPSTKKDGQWYQHINAPDVFLVEKETVSPKKLNDRLPAMYIAREKKRSLKEFPFSLHDNIYALKDSMEMFTYGVGIKKFPKEHMRSSLDIASWWQGTKVIMADKLADFSIYQTSYMGLQDREHHHLHRRYPKNHSERSQNVQKQTDIMWLGKNDNTTYQIPLEVLAVTQHPSNLPINPRKYCRYEKSFSTKCI
ncbi:testis-expressed protein 36 [Callorhinchus milii]|uniref:Domain of unknown function with conserved HDNR motif domain-containing protein n=1 Tax=Callorhinchus milii TaxID=7868 RepID=V9KQ74_CALMI|nr:testis-expressed protein 36 [Callorhinchus milii]|eukprot:gi/632971397/ref/XP_007902152.1/ PREDICTED: testis-expressed sequence 36 protein [Callorhinchus milii]